MQERVNDCRKAATASVIVARDLPHSRREVVLKSSSCSLCGCHYDDRFRMSENARRATRESVIIMPETLTGPVLRIFHVDDSVDDQVLFQSACRSAKVPCEWHATDSAEKGIEYLKSLVALRSAQQVIWPDLVLLDVRMHVHKGWEVLRFIRTSPVLRMLPVIILSDSEDPNDLKEALALGANSFLSKPGGFEEMVELVRSLYEAWTMARKPTL